MQVPLLYVFTVKRNETQKSWITGSRPHWCETQNQFSNLISLTPELSLFLNTVLPSAESTAAAKSPQSCPTLCDPIDGSPPGSPIPGILQARTLEWVAISFSNVWKWKVKVESLSSVRLFVTPWTAAYQVPLPMGFSRQEYWSGVPLPSPFAESSKWQSTLCMLYVSGGKEEI